MTSWLAGALAALVFATAALTATGLWWLWQPRLSRRRLVDLQAADAGASAGPPSAAQTWRALARWTRPIARLARPREDALVSAVRQRLMHAGIRHAHAVAAFFGLKALAGLGLPVAGLALIGVLPLAPQGRAWPLVLGLLAALGYYAPNLWVARRAGLRQRTLFETFPDALDLMTVCVEAGLGTEAALARVANDMATHSPPLAEELQLLNLELRAGVAREQALRHLAMRTGVEEIESFVVMLLQAERFGTPLSQSLRVHADMLRTRRRQRAEEAAAKIALKLLFPLIFCIFPALMVVLMGPAMLQIHRVLLPSMGAGG